MHDLHRPRRLLAGPLALVAALALCAGVLAGCSDDGPAASGSTSSTTPTSTAVAGACDQGPTVEEVRAVPVDGVPSDLTITSFDGTELRVHWFPTEAATGDEPAPTVLMGPGWSLPGDTSREGAGLFGALSIGSMNEAGYNVLTWDPRGFGASTGAAEVNAPDVEGRDAQILLDWVAEQPEALTERDGDPRVGMVGFSYGGGIQLTLAGIDCRVDVIVPGLAWNSLETSLFRSETMKSGWAGLLVSGAGGGTVDPHVLDAYDEGLMTGVLSDENREWFDERGPGSELVGRIRIPTLIVQGTVDTLFTLDEAVRNHEILRTNDVPTAMLWFCGGHGSCRTEEGDTSRVSDRTFAWLDHHLKGDTSVDTGAAFEFVDQYGTWWSADRFPVERGAPVTATGSGSLTLVADGGATLTTPLDGGGILDGLVSDITPGPATHSVDVAIVGPDTPATVLGAPTLRLRYRGELDDPSGERPTRVFAQLVDVEHGVVIGNQITPVPVRLDGGTHTVELPLETIAQHLTEGAELTLQLVATTSAYTEPQLGGRVTFEYIEVSLPTASGLVRAG